MRIECQEPGFEQNWVEVSDRWTRRETANLYTVAGEEYFVLLRQKVTACNIVPVVGDPITDPQGIAPDNLMDCDETVHGFLGGALQMAIAERRRIGNFSGRPSSATNGATK
jgi:hypothetical protein